jgi:N-acetylneuraminate synthase
MEIQIGSRKIGPNHPTYFIADVAANHDGDLERAKLLIRLAKEAGADAAKFQNFRAPEIVSDYGFRHMSAQVSHQATWKKSVFQFFVATGASTIGEVQRAVHAVVQLNPQLVLMQCNTNYTASPDNYDHLHLNVLKTFATMFPDVILGLSDHTHALAPVLGAVALGARVIERHFTDSNNREGPDHKFAMNPESWAKMVEETRLLERALGSPDKTIAANEIDTAVVQRRCLRSARDIRAGEVFDREMIAVLRPAAPGAIKPHEIPAVIGARALCDMPQGKELRWTDLGE